MNNKLRPALIGGGALGLLLVLTVVIAALPIPVVRMVGCCNCLWPIAGGLVATMLYVKGSPIPVTVLDGAIVGALAGVVGGVIYMIVGLPISFLINGVDALDAQVRAISPEFPLGGIALLVIGGIVGFVIFVVLATVGGLIGVPLFEKRKDNVNVPPPPPSPVGNPPGSFGTGI
ncbi:MAG TPA: hypothetical protein VJ864_13410 [Candidatus Binatia bacterium]|nr:hypothetical protein [Candidatus Binatia bacterium]